MIATGATERPIVFADDDRPGIMLASAASAYVTRYGARPGTTAVIFTTNDTTDVKLMRELLEADTEDLLAGGEGGDRRDARNPLRHRTGG